jgi:hypothetical protein
LGNSPRGHAAKFFRQQLNATKIGKQQKLLQHMLEEVGMYLHSLMEYSQSGNCPSKLKKQNNRSHGSKRKGLGGYVQVLATIMKRKIAPT